jgi:Ca2+-binding RTX toxin-like protein
MGLRRAATVVALTGAGLAIPAASALAASTVNFASGTVTVAAADNNEHGYLVEYDTPSASKITLHDAGGGVAVGANPGPCSNSGSDVVCDSTVNAINTIHVEGGADSDVVETSNATSADVLTFNGNGGTDTLRPHAETDTFNGGAGHDTADYADGQVGPINVSADGVANDGAAGETDNIGADVEEIRGTNESDTLTASSSAPAVLVGLDGADTLTGGDAADVLEGDAGNDTLSGGDGADTFFTDSGNDTANGGPGDDFFVGDPGADDLHGGPGFDDVTYGNEPYNGPGPVAVAASLDDVANDGANGQDGSGVDGAGAAADNVHSDVEEIDGSEGNDTLTGDAAVNELFGGPGNDTITGGGGNDFLFGDDGNDNLLARDNTADLVACGDGNDTATTDDIDTVSGCEANSSAPATLPVKTVTIPVTDTTPPKVTLGSVRSKVKRKSLLKSGISFTLTASEAVSYDVQLTGTLKGAHVAAKAGDLVLAGKALSSSGAKTTVRLKLTSRTKKAIGRHAKLRLTVVAIDGGGNKVTVTRTIRVT